MKSVLLSIKPQWCKLIASGKKTIEVRKTKPKIETPFKCYIYCTQDYANYTTKTKHNYFWVGEPLNSEVGGRWVGNGKVIGEFVCDKIFEIDFGIEEGVCFDGVYQQGFETNGIGNNYTCLSFIDLEKYLTDTEGYGWHISDLVIYDEPKELSEFRLYNRNCELFFNNPVKCFDCKGCNLKHPPQSWLYVEELK